MGGGHLNIGGRLHTELYHPQNSGSALTNSFIRANAAPPSPYGAQYSPFANQDESFPPLVGRQQSRGEIEPALLRAILCAHGGDVLNRSRDGRKGQAAESGGRRDLFGIPSGGQTGNRDRPNLGGT